MNWTSLPNAYNHNAILGRAIRRASGRLLVVQSAGNQDDDACRHSYNFFGASDPNDGILVVGGTDRFGRRYPQRNNPWPYASESRSNYGPCVEVWAPGTEMTTMAYDLNYASYGGPEFFDAYTGTSFAAPLVAAVAGRYGDSTTRPIEREAYVRNGMVFTGGYDEALGSNLPINLVQYYDALPLANYIPKRLPIVSATSLRSMQNINKLFDQKFYDGIDWNAGSNSGSVLLDLGQLRQVSGVRLMIRSSAQNEENINFTVYGGAYIGSANDLITSKTVSGQYDLVPYYIPLSGNYRSIRIDAVNFGSWVSYPEIEVYGPMPFGAN